MQYNGHVENGNIVLDEPADLQNGARVRIDLLYIDQPQSCGMPLRGTAYQYDDPFAPALNAEDWDAIQ